jgi:hypothetical protein
VTPATYELGTTGKGAGPNAARAGTVREMDDAVGADERVMVYGGAVADVVLTAVIVVPASMPVPRTD